MGLETLELLGAARRLLAPEERIVIELMTSDCKLKASREGSKGRIYGT